MKKFLLIFSLLLVATFVSAQSTSPRWGSGPPSNDNTGRILTYAKKAVTTTASQASAYQVVSAYQTIITVGTLTHALTDSVSVGYSYFGDQITFVFTADTLTAGRVVTFGNHLKSAGTLTVPNSKSSHSGEATATFIFDGTKWTEVCRAINTN